MVAAVTIVAPDDGSVFQVDLDGCQAPPCQVEITFVIEVVGSGVERVELHSLEGSESLNFFVCFPGDDIEPDGDPCPEEPAFTVEETLSQGPGSYTIVASAIRSSGTEESAPVSFTVEGPTASNAPVILSAVNPPNGAPRIFVREPGTPLDPGWCQCPPPPTACESLDWTPTLCSGDSSCTVPDTLCYASETSAQFPSDTQFPWGQGLLVDNVRNEGIEARPTRIDIEGVNLLESENPFLRVFLAPKPPAEPTLTPDSPLPISDWCLWEATIVGREPIDGGGSKLTLMRQKLTPI